MSSRNRSRSPDRRERAERSRYDDDDRRRSSNRDYRPEDSKRRAREDYDDNRYDDRKRPRGSYNGHEDTARSDRRRNERSRERRDDRRQHRSRSAERERRRDYDHERYKGIRREDKEGGRQEGGPSTSRRPARDSPADSRARSRSPSRSGSADAEKDKDKGKPNFNQSGLLAAETNTVRLSDGSSTVLKYNEPPEARKPTVGWRLYVFKGEEQSDPLLINRQSCYTVGRDRAITDIFVEHPSCSKQHAAIQYRQIKTKDEFGSISTNIKPFIIDLESTNGTLVNDEKIPAARYYELQVGDVIKFGLSTREYVLMRDDA